jgi:uncharacterized membrane protein YkvA (DUF1232 family)
MPSTQNLAERLPSEAPPAKDAPAVLGLKFRASHYLRKAYVIYLVMKHPESPYLAKTVAALSVGYLFSPIQLIPSFIPVFGWLDDIAVLSAGMWLLNRLTPESVILQCRAQAIARTKGHPEVVARQETRTWRFLQ